MQYPQQYDSMTVNSSNQQPTEAYANAVNDSNQLAQAERNHRAAESVAVQDNTPDNSYVDVFEYEPIGFMSKGRW